MVKNECKIVKDLFPSYVDNLTSIETNEFVESHLKTCNNCNKILETLKKGEKQQEKRAEEKEVDYLKKHNRKIKILSIIAIILTLSIISAWGYKMVNYYKTENDYKIIDNIYNKYIEIRNGKNYKLTIENKYNDKKVTLIYKEDKKKETDENNIPFVTYGKVLEENTVTLSFQNGEPSGYSVLDNTDIISNNICDASFVRLNIYHNRRANQIIDIREEKYEGKDYYVLKENTENESCIELWVNKQTLLVEREISKSRNDKKYYYEHKFTWDIGNVTDEEIKMTQEEKESAYKYIEEYPEKAKKGFAKHEGSTQEEKDKALRAVEENIKKIKKLVDTL